ncbi:retinoblastoma-binding protein [Aspergillus lentulus]|nr:retinoblastoma-binding protein [Aspergillus lentulus]
MSSSVHFKFKSQKEPSRVTFDGTGISVFELKREIINQSRLGDGSDFELSIYNEDTGEEYDDDTTIIPRSTSVIARRLPASRPGKGGAARYVSGKMPVSARSAPRNDASMSTRAISHTSNTVSNSVLELNNAQTEEEKINALFNLQASQWKEQQQEMANATPVPFGRGRGKAVNVPDHPPPPGYLCYRCREKGHWIQACPTNNDPKFDGKYRVKRSTGIPRSLQTKVEKPESLALDGSNEDLRNTGVMVNADGDFVIAKPDKAAWELYQEKAKASSAAAAEAAAAEYSKELQSWGLECPIDKRMFLEPTKTPCCHRTYCNDCITNALIESDFVCPGCATEGVLLDNLSVDEEAVSRIKAFEDEKADSRKDTQKNLTVHDSSSNSKVSDSERTVAGEKELSSLPSVNGALDSATKKRPADENLPSIDHEGSNLSPSNKKQKADPIAQATTVSTNLRTQDSSNEVSSITNDQPMPFGFGFMNPQSMPTMPFTEAGFMGGGMGFMNPLGLPTNGFPNNLNQAWNPMNNMGFDSLQDGIYGSRQSGAMNGYGQANMYSNMENASMQMMGMSQMAAPISPNAGFQQGPGVGHFSNQQRTSFSSPFAREEDSPYFRQPVNPQRHQGRHRRIRPSDYREL